MTEFENIAAEHCKRCGLSITLSSAMPSGYETAFGTYDPDTKTLHLNLSLLKGAPRPDGLFYLYHELRHAEQYQHPERFCSSIQRSLPYVILYNGTCFKQTSGGWKHCEFQGESDYFTTAYLSLPYEMDANSYACQQLTLEPGCESAAEQLRRFWLPRQPLSPEEFNRLFQRIDEAIQ